ncbi:MAG TPA: NAD(P)-dependent alcohol dehydrogenase [Vicinamibacterales bacterium]|nr:NAD(P)-dependent alcohol dehydrogenase [Vicinamibacterales bacterium]
MKALIRDRYGLPDVLEVREMERPFPKPGEVLVRVHAASINDWDWGLLQEPTLPFLRWPPKPILGSDVAGRVVALGSGVRRFRVGDAVYGDLCRMGPHGWGGFAEYVCARERSLVLKPDRMTFEQAAALPQAGQLAVQGLFAAGPLKPGQKILINGAGGGVGTIGVQIAKAQGAEVTGVDSAMKLEMMRSIGFDHVIDYQTEDFTKNGKCYDLIVDTKTTRSPAEYARSLNPGGTYASVGGPEMKVLFGIMLAGWARGLVTGKRLRLVGLKPNRDLPYLNEQFEAGHLVPVIDGPYALDQGADALRHFGSGNHKGKVVITMV